MYCIIKKTVFRNFMSNTYNKILLYISIFVPLKVNIIKQVFFNTKNNR